MTDEDEPLDTDLETSTEPKTLLQHVHKQLLSVDLRCLRWRMVESATQAVWHTVRTIVMDLLIDVDEAEEDHGQWMYTSLEDVCFVFICL